jgi:hypothetical protein
MEHILFIKERFHVGVINNAETAYYLPHDDGCLDYLMFQTKKHRKQEEL